MAKYIPNPIPIEATRWWVNGDHPLDACETFDNVDGPFQGEDHIVRYHRTPEVASTRTCAHCKGYMRLHGWIDTPEGGHIVCPGDYIVTGLKGEYYPCKPDIFEMKYRPV